MKMKRLFSVLLTALLLLESVGIALAAAPTTMQEKLTAVEKAAYGQAQTGALLDRLNKLEKDFSSSNPKSSVMDRVDALYALMLLNETGPSLVTQMNAVEWAITRQVSMESIQKRVSDMEITMQGKPTEGSYRSRIDTLASYAFGSADIPLSAGKVPANTLVRILTVTPINAKNLKAGDQIEFQAAEDVVEGGRLLYAKGAPGVGVVKKVKQAQNFGRDAEVDIDFQSLRAIDGTETAMLLGEESKKKMESLAMAAGASLAGIALLGPFGVIGGIFVKGKNIDLPAGTELYIQTKDETSLYGLNTSLHTSTDLVSASADVSTAEVK